MFLFRGCNHKRNMSIGIKIIGEAVGFGEKLPFDITNELYLCKECGVIFVPIGKIDSISKQESK